MASIKRNFAWNLLLTVSNYLFPLITYPYVSRVLGVANIGVCNFTDGIINYFVLVAQLGIGTYGVREIARCKDNPERMKEVFSNLFFINIFTFVIAALVLVICTYSLSSLVAYKPFLLVGLLKLLFSLFLIEWFFQGIEQFKYITIRSVLVKTLYVVAIFVFVRNSGDSLKYYALTCFTIVLNAIWNWVFSKKYVRLSLRNLKPKVFIYPILIFGYYRLLTSMYTTLNVVYLGFATDDVQVGYFATATKFYAVIMAAFTAFTTVMIPRVSVMLSQGRREELQHVIDQISHVLVALSLPIIVLCCFNSHSIIHLFAGSGYEGAETPFMIVMFLLLIIGMEQIVIQQCLMASTNIKLTAVVSTVGAVVGVLCNIFLTPRYGAVGSAISWGVSEVSVLCVGLYLLKKDINIVIKMRVVAKPVLYSALYVALLIPLYYLIDNIWIRLSVSAALVGVVFLIINLWLDRNEITDSFVSEKLLRQRRS